MKEFDPARAAVITEATQQSRGRVAIAKGAVQELRGRTLINPKTLVESSRRRVALRLAERAVKKGESATRKELDLFEAHFTSPTVAKFYDDAIERAVAHGMTPSAMALSHLQTLDSASLYEWRHNQVSWDNQPDEVKAVFEIAMTIAKADLKGKGRREYILAVGEGRNLMIPEDDAFKGDSSEKPFGMSNPDTAVVGELYKLLGLEEKIQDIPRIPGFNRFVHNDIVRVHNLSDYGVKLSFSFSGLGAEEFGNGKEVPLNPAHIGMTVEAKKTLVK